MGDAGEGLIDADSRIQERLEDIAREREERRGPAPQNPEAQRALESLRLARTDLERQMTSTTHEGRRAHLAQALAEIDRQMGALQAQLA